MDINDRIASRVRQIRAERGLSLEALAESSGVSRSMISLIERGQSSATAVVLEKLATGLDVPLAWLFDAPAASASPVSRRSEQVEWRDPASGYTRRNVSPSGSPSPVRIVEVVFPAGARVSYETGARPGLTHQQIWVLQGAIEVTLERFPLKLNRERFNLSGKSRTGVVVSPGVFRPADSSRTEYALGKERYELGTGDCLAMVLDRPITFRNRTAKPARYAVILSHRANG